MSATKKIIAVLGSTGVQGGSVVHSLLEDGSFQVRAVTRNANSEAARSLKSLGVEVVSADLEDVDSLRKAFRGAYGVFGLTVWSLYATHKGDPVATQAHEEKHGRNLIDAAEAEAVEHFVWSTVHRTDAFHVYHFESKANVDKYLKSKKLPRTSLYTSVYFSNLTMFNWLEKDNNGFVLKLPIYPGVGIVSYDAYETGAWALPAFKNPEEWIGKDIDAVGETLTVEDYLDTLRRVTGKNVRLDEISKERFYSKEFREQIGEELWLNMRLLTENHFHRDHALSLKVNPSAATFEDFVKRNVQLKAFMGY